MVDRAKWIKRHGFTDGSWRLEPRTPTIYVALRDKLGREPTRAELRSEVQRIIAEGTAIGKARRK